MGVFSVLMFVSMTAYYNDDKDATLSVIFIVILVSAYLFPLVFHLKSLMIVEFLKGVVYLIFMTPTFINIFSIYAVSNIHDITWGSRPSLKNKDTKKTKREKNIEIDYKNYRSNYLVFWLMVNIAVGFTITNLSRSKTNGKLAIIAIILAAMVGLKVLFSIIHICYDYGSKIIGRNRLKRKEKQGKKFEIEELNDSDQKSLTKIFRKTKTLQMSDKKLNEHLVESRGNLRFDLLLFFNLN